jgi:hypothetical protein
MKTHNDTDINIIMTHLQGHIDCSYAELVAAFGQPQEGDHYKVECQWAIEENGVVATIYDYKTGPTYCGRENGILQENNRDWHIGGFTPEAVALVHARIKKP